MYRFLKDRIVEDSYVISDEMKNATLFGIGNGYFGQRGSYEEFGDAYIQGTYVRGVFDEIIEIPEAISDNSYMKKYYFDEEKLKEFECEDSCVNIGDISAFRICIGGIPFRLWNHKIVSYERSLDFYDGGLSRSVTVEDESWNRTKLDFHKVFSFANDHLFLQSLRIEKLNHDLPVRISSGIDLLCKTNGQHKLKDAIFYGDPDEPGIRSIKVKYGKKYGIEGYYRYRNETGNLASSSEREKCYGDFESYSMEGRVAEIRKVVSYYASIDPKGAKQAAAKDFAKDYEVLYKEHRSAYEEAFAKIDIRIKGNEELDGLLRYCNYQTLIGFNRNDYVHSLSAKNLTAEKYNQFVWWDCEIYQMPFFLMTFPKEAKNLLLYRYNRLEEAKKNAAKDGYRGAKYAFCSGVKGDELVWIYAKHPFLQIHIDSDIAYAVLNYYYHTLDEAFLRNYGFEMIEQIVLYFISRSAYENGAYHLRCVTGTDEHHDYVDDDAYTNACLKFVLKEFMRLKEKLGYGLKELGEEELRKFERELYVPGFIGKILPQFEGYLSLNPGLEIEGKSDSKAYSFQMKQSGLYHLSQIIKQPDVLLLYTYLNIGFKENYPENYRYYVEKCEAGSSLTYCVHALAAIDNGDTESFEKDLMNSLRIDFDDLMGNSAKGLHAASLASGYYLFTRGLLGLEAEEGYLRISPKKVTFFEGYELTFVYHGIRIAAKYGQKGVTFAADETFPYVLEGGERKEAKRLEITWDSLNRISEKEERK